MEPLIITFWDGQCISVDLDKDSTWQAVSARLLNRAIQGEVKEQEVQFVSFVPEQRR